ncbi:hypothetical protein ACWGPQ_18205 [Saccharomonospora azurea]
MRQASRSRWVPPAVLVIVLAALASVLHAGRLGVSLVGGALLPVGDLGEVWSEYLAAWHGVAGGASGGAPPALAVLGVLGAPLAPLGGPAAAVALLLLADVPLAALSAYAATRRLRVGRWVRAAVAAAYGLLPPATAAAAQGRVDVVVVHVLLPLLLAGIGAALGWTEVRARWLSASALCALGVATVAAFSPLSCVLLLVVASFVFVASPGRDRPRARAGAFAVVALLPPALLLPWLPVLVEHPGLVVRGVNGTAADAPTLGELVTLDPGGPGGTPVGVVVVIAALLAVVSRPSRRLWPAAGLVAVGAFGVAVTSFVETSEFPGGLASPAFVGVPLLFVGAGLLLALLLSWSTPEREGGRTPRERVVTAAALGGVLALAVGAVLGGRSGPLENRPVAPLAPLADDLAATGRGVLELANPGESTAAARLTAGRPPRFGDDAMPSTEWMGARLRDWHRHLLTGTPDAVADAVTSAAAAGVSYVVLPPGEDGRELRDAAGHLVEPAPATSDGRTVLRLTAEAGTATLISAEQARRSVTGQAPDAELLTAPASAAVAAAPPEIGVRVSEGPEGRLLLVAAAHEPGWRATVDGVGFPIVRAWGGQVAVAVPPESAEVRVRFDDRRHDVLLLGQLAAVLFTVLTAVPSLRRPR